MSTSTLPDVYLLLIAYGSEERRIEVEMRPTVPSTLVQRDMARMHQWAQGLLLKLGMDIKHTQQWGCEICGEPGRETSYSVVSWLHLPQPRLVVYVHHVCDAGAGPCIDMIDRMNAQVSLSAGMPPTAQPRLPKLPGQGEFPLAGSCGKCNHEETGRMNMNRCSGCKLIRYCSVDCQRKDWSRHKEICKLVKDVKWFWH